VYVACHVHPCGSAGERQSLGLSAPLTVHASDELKTAVQLGGAYHLVLPTSAHALNPDRSLFAFRHGVGLLANCTYICLDKKRISRLGLSCGNSQRSSRRLSPSCPLGVCHQAAWEGVWRCAPQAPGGNLPLGLRRLRGGAERIQRRIRPRPFAGELPTEGSAVRTGEQPQGRLVSSDEAGVSGNLHVQERAQERRCIVVAELFRGIGGRRTNHDSAPVHRGSEPAFCRGALSPGPEPPGTSRGLIGIRPTLDRLPQCRHFARQIEPLAEGLRVSCMLEAIANERRAVGDRAVKIERADAALEEVHDFFLLPPAVPHRRRHHVDVIRKFRADLLSPSFALQTTHRHPSSSTLRPYVLGSFSLSRASSWPLARGRGGCGLRPINHFWKIAFGSIA